MLKTILLLLVLVLCVMNTINASTCTSTSCNLNNVFNHRNTNNSNNTATHKDLIEWFDTLIHDEENPWKFDFIYHNCLSRRNGCLLRNLPPLTVNFNQFIDEVEVELAIDSEFEAESSLYVSESNLNELVSLINSILHKEDDEEEALNEEEEALNEEEMGNHVCNGRPCSYDPYYYSNYYYNPNYNNPFFGYGGHYRTAPLTRRRFRTF